MILQYLVHSLHAVHHISLPALVYPALCSTCPYCFCLAGTVAGSMQAVSGSSGKSKPFPAFFPAGPEDTGTPVIPSRFFRFHGSSAACRTSKACTRSSKACYQLRNTEFQRFTRSCVMKIPRHASVYPPLTECDATCSSVIVSAYEDFLP